MKNIFDSHSHYTDRAFDVDRKELLESFSDLRGIITCASNIKDAQNAVSISEKYDFMYCAVGIHPLDIKTKKAGYDEIIRKLSENKKVVAIGEIGLDYHYKPFDKEQQILLFEEQLTLAKELNLPVIVHNREANAVDFLKTHRPSGVVHCFSGDVTEAKKVLDFGMYLGFTGVITYKNAEITRDVLRYTPLDRLLIETDAPYLSPVPFRGKRCESKMLTYVIETIADIKKVSPERIAEVSAENAEKLFNIC
jgi:TatD DNase family protein